MRPTEVGIGVTTWALLGVAAALLPGWAMGSLGNGFALVGILLVVGSLGWAMGPLKAPLAWSQGALRAYEGNAPSPAQALRTSARAAGSRPVYALLGGVILCALSAALAV